MAVAPLFLTESDLAPFIDMADAVSCLEDAFGRKNDPRTGNAPRTRARTSEGVLNLMGAVDGAAGVFGTKSYFAGADGVTFYVALYELATRRLLCIMESSLMSRVRTGAASGLATKLMARPDASVLGLIGTGRQAFAQAEAVIAVRPIREIRLFGRRAEPRAALADRLRKEFGLTVIEAAESREAVSGSDVVSLITRAAEPVLFGRDLAPGTHVNAAGANAADRREFDRETLRLCRRPVTDDVEQARAEAAEFADAVAAGERDWNDFAELADLVTGRETVHPDAGGVTLFKSLGIAFEDVAYAERLLRRGAEAGAWQDPRAA